MSKLADLVAKQKLESFTPEYQAQATDAEALGIMIAHFFEWDGLRIMETFMWALEDANFHTEAALVHEMIEREKAV